MSVRRSRSLVPTLVFTALVASSCKSDPAGPDRSLSPGWSERKPSNVARSAGVATATVNGWVYEIGGEDAHLTILGAVDAYIPSADGWHAVASLHTPRTGLAAAAVNGIIYAVGGDGDGGYPWLSSVEAYDPAKNSWAFKAAMPNAKIAASAAGLNGILYVVGGWTTTPDSSYMDNSLWAYDPAADHWTVKAPMATRRNGLGVGVINGVLYAVGGGTVVSGSQGHCINTLEAYDPATDTWTTKAPMPTARCGVGVGVIDGVLYAVGGYPDLGAELTTVEAYDPATDSWTTMDAMPTARYSPGVAVVDQVLYAIDGSSGSGNKVHVNEAYVP